MRFNGMFKGFTFRVRRQKFQLPLLRYLLALPHIKHIEPDQLFYPEAATGAWPGKQHSQDMQHSGALQQASSIQSPSAADCGMSCMNVDIVRTRS